VIFVPAIGCSSPAAADREHKHRVHGSPGVAHRKDKRPTVLTIRRVGSPAGTPIRC
jgi:hypothetical protein